MSTANAHVRMTESAPFGAGFQLDTEAGVARGVAVCGFVSANGRDYPPAVLKRDHQIYEGANVFLDHADGERKVREWFGQLKGVRIRESDGKPVADLHYPKTSQFTAEFEERASKFPGSFGLSHVAVCETKRVNGRESITALRRVESVDLVARPATNKSLFESQGNAMDEQKLAEAEQKLTAAQTEVAALKEQVATLTKTVTEQAEKLAAVALDKLFAEAGVKPTEVQRKAVAKLDTEAEQKALVESLKAAAAGEKPVSGEQNAGGAVPAAATVVPTEGKAFAESLRNPK